MHGSIFLHLKTTGVLQRRIGRWMWNSFGLLLVMYIVVTAATMIAVPRAMAPFDRYPLAWVVVALNVVAVLSIPYAMYRDWSGRAFVASCLTVCMFVLLLGLTLFPNLVTSDPHGENSLTIYNAASSPKTLGIMLIVAAVGMPFVVAYTSIIYWVFRGRVTSGEY